MQEIFNKIYPKYTKVSIFTMKQKKDKKSNQKDIAKKQQEDVLEQLGKIVRILLSNKSSAEKNEEKI